MKKIYRHLTSDNRTVIKTLLQENKSYTYIANIIGVHRSTISREIRRNSGLRGYRVKQANNKAAARKVKPRYKKLDEIIREYIITMLRYEYSPEQIAGISVMKTAVSISTETIYKLIIEDKQNGGDLYKSLRINGKRKRKKRVKAPNTRGQIKYKVSIDNRPNVVDTRKRFGDWEADLMSGANHKGFLVTLVERKSGLVRVGHVLHKESSLVKAELIRLLRGYKVKTITFDNGKEFAEHYKINRELGCKSYFCHPYSSWERGSNENTNGLLRQYFPKGMNLLDIPITRIEEVEQRLNSRPRKRLGFKSPLDIYKRAG